MDSGPGANTIRTLLVEDDEALGALASHVLNRDSYFDVIGWARDGTQAFRLADSTRPDLIIVDLVLPGTDGLEVVRQLRQTHPKSIIVVHSMLGDEQSRRAALAHGADAFLEKFTDNEALTARLHLICEQHEHGRAAPLGLEVDLAPNPTGNRGWDAAFLRLLHESGFDRAVITGPLHPCKTCAADRHITIRVLDEMRAARLPHKGCSCYGVTGGTCPCTYKAPV